MKIKYNDDKKEKIQSHEINANNNWCNINCDFQWSLSSYGEDKTEALAEFKRAAEVLIKDIQNLLDMDLSELPDTPRNTQT